MLTTCLEVLLRNLTSILSLAHGSELRSLCRSVRTAIVLSIHASFLGVVIIIPEYLLQCKWKSIDMVCQNAHHRIQKSILASVFLQVLGNTFSPIGVFLFTKRFIRLVKFH